MEMKRTYIQPLTRVVLYGLDGDLAWNGGGMDGTSGGGGLDENWVKEEGDLDDGMWSEDDLPTTGNLWDNAW